MTAKDGFIKIINPKDGNAVPRMFIVKGVSLIPDIKIWVIIHPVSARGYWVQPSNIKFKEDGAWESQAYIGEKGLVNIGAQYEIIAVGNPVINLVEGDVLKAWPKAGYQSQIVKVTRKAGDGYMAIKSNSAKKWYQKTGVHAAIISGLFLLIATFLACYLKR
jgi:hypothetical protein